MSLPVKAAPAGDALDRPAVLVTQPTRVALMAAAYAGQRIVAVGERGVIAMSDDGGKQWRQSPVPTSVTLTAVRFSDERRGVVVGHGGTVLTTEDGGATWTRRLDGRQAAAIAQDAARRSASPSRVKEAQRLVAEGPDKPFLDVLMWDSQRILAVGAYGLAFGTVDGGRTWTSWMDRMPNEKGQHFYVARRSGDTLLVVGEQGLALRSTDNGESFKSIPSPYKGSWFAAEFLGPNDVVLAGLRGNVWRSSDAGRRWTQVANQSQASITASRFSGGYLLMSNQAGMVLRLDGDALVPINREPIAPLAAIIGAGRNVLGFGSAGVQHITAGAK